MTRTTDQWEALLKNTEPGPWGIEVYVDNGVAYPQSVGPLSANFYDYDATYLDDHASEEMETTANHKLAAVAPESVTEVIRLRRELETLLDTLKYETWLHDDGGQFPEVVQMGRYATGQLTRILNDKEQS